MPDEAIQTKPEFLEEAKIAMGSLRSALLELVEGTGDDLGLPQELARRYKLDKTLTWKISRIVRDEEISSAVVHVPGRRRMNTLLSALKDGGASNHAINSVWKAFDEFERLVEIHSGDRSTLDVMVAGSSVRMPERRFENLRKAGFQCNASVWGVRARLHFGMHVISPSVMPDMLDACTLCGFLGLERLRPKLPWTIADAVSWEAMSGQFGTLPLHPDGAIGGTPILPEFCSKPVPKLRVTEIDATNRRFELPEGAVGLGNAVDITLGWKWPPMISMHAEREGELGEHGISISTPVEMVVHDLWVHRSLSFAMNPVARVYSRLPSGPRYPNEGRDAGIIPVPDTVIDLGYGAASSSMAEFPRCSELLQFAMTQRGWNQSDFRGFRFRLKYPPIPTLGVFQHPLLPMKTSPANSSTGPKREL
jgi:hypothetical protein